MVGLLAIIAVVIAVVILALESELITTSNRRSDGKKRPSHTGRLIVSMLLGALGGLAFVPRTENSLEPLMYATSGALAGLAVELFRRLLKLGDRT